MYYESKAAQCWRVKKGAYYKIVTQGFERSDKDVNNAAT